MQEKKSKLNNYKTKIIPPKKKTELSRDEIRSANKKKIRRKRKFKRLVSFGFITALVCFAVIILVVLLFFRIEKIEITGAKVYSDKKITEICGIKEGDNLYGVSEDKLNKKLTKSLPFVKSVTIKRKLPDTLIIDIKASKEIAAIEYGTGFVLLDENGKILDSEATMLKENVAIVKGVKLGPVNKGETVKLKNETVTKKLINLLKAVKKSEIMLLTEIIADKNGNFELMYDSRIKVKLGDSRNLETKLRLCKATVERENEINPYTEGVIDLRVDGKAFFKAGKEEKTTLPPMETTLPETSAVEETAE